MSYTRTVFVLGAGASCELGLPDGDALKRIVARKVNVNDRFSHEHTEENEKLDQIIQSYMDTTFNFDRTPYDEARNIISRGIEHEVSIDNFLKSHSDNKKMLLVGKIAIVLSILEAEKNSAIISNADLNDVRSWHRVFFMNFFSGLSFDEALEKLNHTDFIVFNYDRCLECYLIKAFVLKYHLDETGLFKVFDNLNVLHPYGYLGNLFERSPNRPGVDLGYQSHDYYRYLEISKGIYTFNEEVEKENLFLKTKAIMTDAEKIIFLGFACHAQNMKFLRIDTTGNLKNVYATAYKVSQPNIGFMNDRIKSIFPKNKFSPEIYEGKCEDFFQEYSGVFSN